MPIVQYEQFPDDEREDFENACRAHGADPISFSVTANEEHFPLGNGLHRVDRLVSVERDQVNVQLHGVTWVAEFNERFGLFRHRADEQ